MVIKNSSGIRSVCNFWLLGKQDAQHFSISGANQHFALCYFHIKPPNDTVDQFMENNMAGVCWCIQMFSLESFKLLFLVCVCFFCPSHRATAKRRRITLIGIIILLQWQFAAMKHDNQFLLRKWHVCLRRPRGARWEGEASKLRLGNWIPAWLQPPELQIWNLSNYLDFSYNWRRSASRLK